MPIHKSTEYLVGEAGTASSEKRLLVDSSTWYLGIALVRDNSPMLEMLIADLARQVAFAVVVVVVVVEEGMEDLFEELAHVLVELYLLFRNMV